MGANEFTQKDFFLLSADVVKKKKKKNRLWEMMPNTRILTQYGTNLLEIIVQSRSVIHFQCSILFSFVFFAIC